MSLLSALYKRIPMGLTKIPTLCINNASWRVLNGIFASILSHIGLFRITYYDISRVILRLVGLGVSMSDY